VQALVERLRPVFGPSRCWFPTTVQGWGHLPDRGALLVANHSGGTIIPDVWGCGAAGYREHGAPRPLHALGHEMIFAAEASARFVAQRGVLRATPEAAQRVLAQAQRDLLVLPGGDLDTWRPWSARYKVDFNGRKGYARAAIQAQAPVVPVAHAGAHDTLIVLGDGRRLARALRFPQLFRAHIFPVHLSLPYGLGVGPWPHLPPPTPLRYRLGPALTPPRWQGEGPPPPAMVEAFDAEVRAALQAELDVLRDEHEGLVDRLSHLARRVGARVVAEAQAAR
jgi:1-acyl-sn-glycerol-3-phosphate acyltransferase